MPMTMKEAAEAALQMQNACNLSGLVHSLAEILSEAIWPAARELGQGTDWVAKHPIVTITLDKLMSLNEYEPLEWRKAYIEVCKLAGDDTSIYSEPPISPEEAAEIFGLPSLEPPAAE